MVLNIPNDGEKDDKGFFLRRDVRETGSENFSQANFNPDDFLVDANIVNLKNKTSFWKCAGSNFINTDPGSFTVTYNANNAHADIATEGAKLVATVSLPHGAVVTGAIVYGAGTGGWILRRINNDFDSSQALANANIGTEDTSISSATIDNENFIYFFTTEGGLSNGSDIEGARITYTTDYD